MTALLYDLELFYQMISCCHEICLWECNEELHLGSLFDEKPHALALLFEADNCKQALSDPPERPKYPMILSNEFGLTWTVVFPVEETQRHLYVLGPYFTDDFSIEQIEAAILRKKLSPLLTQEFSSVIRPLPIISIVKAMEYAVMLHYCINRQRINMSDLVFFQNRELDVTTRSAGREGHGTWASEQAMLQLITDGNLNYRDEMSHLINIGNIGKLSNGEPVRQVKNACIIFSALCCRAAVKGGLNAEISYCLADHYIQSIEAAKSIGEITEICYAMQDDYVHRVHRCKTNSLSPEIKNICDYIGIHVEKNCSLDELAEKVGYSKYYLSKKFKREIGCTIVDYINKTKVDRAKTLLTGTGLEIQEISEQLGFGGQSYFAECFRKYADCSPAEYRNQVQNPAPPPQS
ncbi:MAG: AraC family transcriptional regulator [Eubacterium sp.]|nr:AraC family transcriptional regulator [Eubacterium sp.]MCM1304845.1 AraC family transcriptional regulator [Butyrivibrio sp.]MCM1344868.1 AraC family transcriptional regulator [Muribaculaceae bacterium]MCM1411767.1 AraC family transcriptional regulator [Lachnospiraceae bacterium]MCM1541892.1 AraC family transcriptional regulator [Blautia sp.]